MRRGTPAQRMENSLRVIREEGTYTWSFLNNHNLLNAANTIEGAYNEATGETLRAQARARRHASRARRHATVNVVLGGCVLLLAIMLYFTFQDPEKAGQGLGNLIGFLSPIFNIGRESGGEQFCESVEKTVGAYCDSGATSTMPRL